jgi:hypothetical protein
MTFEDDDKPEVKEEPKERKTIKRPRESSPKEIKATQKMLTGLLDQIQEHKDGSLFAKPVTSASRLLMVTGLGRALITYRVKHRVMWM